LFLSKTGIVKRRSIAKELAERGLVKLNGNTAKPASTVKEKDIIKIGGKKLMTLEILKIPTGNVKKEDRGEYFAPLAGT